MELIVALALIIARVPAESGQCLDSNKYVPMNLMSDSDKTNSPATDVVRTDTIVWTRRTGSEIIGFAYTRKDGRRWISTRKFDNMTPAGVRQFSSFLSSVALNRNVLAVAPVDRFSNNGSINYEVDRKLPTLRRFGLHLSPCVVWPKNKPLT